MKNITIKLVVGFLFFGAALGLTFILGDGIADPIKEVMSYGNTYVLYTVTEIIGYRILQVVGVGLIWVFAYVFNRVVVKELTS